MASRKPRRTVTVPEETGRFTREQIDAAISKAKEERERKAAARPGKPPRQREGEAKRGGHMTSKKPWRTLISVGDSAGRFTREQVEAAVVKVMGERERKAAAKAARVRKVSGGSASREGDTAKPTKTPARQPRKTPKAA